MKEVCRLTDTLKTLLTRELTGDGSLDSHKKHAITGLNRVDEAELFRSWLFEGRPYGHLPSGRTGALNSIRDIEIKQFIENRYVRGAAVMGVSGSVVDVNGGLDNSNASDCIRVLRRTLSDHLPPRMHKDATPRGIEIPNAMDILLLESQTDSPTIVFGRAIDQAMGDDAWASSLVGLVAIMNRVRENKTWRTKPPMTPQSPMPQPISTGNQASTEGNPDINHL